MGEVRVPADALWRAQTQRAVENFPISGRGLERAQIRALGLVKGAAARVNGRIGVLDQPIADAIAAAADEVAAGERGRPLPRRRLPDRLGHQLEHERQRGDRHPRRARRAPRCTRTTTSTPRSRPTTCSRRPSTWPPPRRWPPRSCPRWSTSPPRCAAAPTDWADVVKAGRTHLMDAVPITLGQEAGGWATQVEYGAARVTRRAAAAGPAADRRHRGRHRAERAGRVRRRRRRGAARGHRAGRAVRGRRPHRGPGRARRAGGGLRRAAHRRRVALQDRQRHPLARLRPAHRARRAAAARPAAGQLDHAGQGQPGDLRGHDDGRRAGDRATTPPSRSPAARATCSST